MIRKLSDKANHRLIHIEKNPTSEYWDEHWNINRFNKTVIAGKCNNFVRKHTMKYLAPGARVLDGGCGIGQLVYGLSIWGYDSYGIDFAKKTIEKIRNVFPQLKVSVQDVRNTEFSDSFFDGYWSVGVIEHFHEGYEEIINEARRIIRPGGYLFLTCPYLSPLRKFKIRLGLYENVETGYSTNNFYQFILDDEVVRRNVEKEGFKLILKRPYDATKGMKDEISLVRPFLRKIYGTSNVLAKVIRGGISLLFSKTTSHAILLVFLRER